MTTGNHPREVEPARTRQTIAEWEQTYWMYALVEHAVSHCCDDLRLRTGEPTAPWPRADA
ncbi:hypothetical protein C7445_102252 [Alicyclobacillus sacchari]|uniref:Uncharacterized protein n=1 Tax=Alicyclobacillus sacchari TaxID=392010 RepID=A0A4R8LU56_9BACL|nr:hypothetical protein [Alicyclobacillus sacchari]TDY50692.1 hypothetical protein C7445_102252 [Alicyclobacillus sacchari]GMA55672.1 hypothetical protein GCM10025858_01750 [Alicyclobacillus sacchari]